MRTLALVVILVGCGAGQPTETLVPAPVAEAEVADDSAPSPAPPPIPTEVLEPAVAEIVLGRPSFEGWTIVPLAQVERGQRIAAVVWPAIAPNGQVVDDDVIGVTLERAEDGSLTVIEENWGTRDPETLTQQLLGEPTRVRRGEGVPAAELGELLATLPARFAEHVRAGDRAAAAEAAVSFSRLFDFRRAALDDTVTELLIQHVTGEVRIETDAPVTRGGVTRVPTRFFQGDTLAEAEDLVATPVDGDPARWVFTDHERTDAGEM